MDSALFTWLEALDCNVAAYQVFIEDLYNAFETKERNRNYVANRKAALSLLVLNLFAQDCTNKKGSIVIYSAKAAFSQGYYPSHLGLSYRALKFATDCLVQAGYMITARSAVFKKYCATYRISEKLSLALKPLITISDLSSKPRDKSELVILSARKKKLSLWETVGGFKISISDTQELRESQNLLANYNSLLREARIEIPDYNHSIRRTEMVQKYTSLDGSDKLTHHGRLYGHWAQSIPKELRLKITINDEAVCEPDIRSAHTAFLYIKAGIDFRTVKGTQLSDGSYDLYGNFSFDNFEGGCSQHRAFAKAILTACINNKSERGCRQSLANKLNEDYQQAISNCRQGGDWKTVFPIISREDCKRLDPSDLDSPLQLVLRRHEAIYDYLFQDSGHWLMFLDSRVAMKVVSKFTLKNEPVISNHESFICRKSLRDEMVQTMFEALAEVTEEHINKGYKLPYSAHDLIRN